MKARIWRIVVFALRFTSDRFFARFVHYLPLWRGQWMGRLNLRNPKLFSEKLLWLKLHIDRVNPEAHLYADKLAVREYVAKTIGEAHLVPVLGIWDRADDIVWADLPERFALKTNHGAGFNILVRDRSELDTEGAEKQVNAWLKTEWWRVDREHQYRRIPPKVFAEELLGSGNDTVPDYKFWCINGRCQLLQVVVDRFSDPRSLVVDPAWNPIPIDLGFPPPEEEIMQPREFDRMLSIAEQLAAPFPFISVDLYEVEGRVFFGELTFNPTYRISSPDWNRKLGEMLTLPG